MIETIEKILRLVFLYFTGKPKITLSIKKNGCRKGSDQIIGRVHFQWNCELIMHNDSAHLIRGIKLLHGFPTTWKIRSEVPTRLEPDQRIRIPFEAHFEEDRQELLSKFGEQMQDSLGKAVFPTVIATVILEFELTNEQGRTFYQYSKFNEDGTVNTEISSRRHDKGS
jgi:hypothetical protein